MLHRSEGVSLLGREATIVAAACVTLFLVSCDDQRLSKDEFIEQADAICSEANEELGQEQTPTTPEEFHAFARKAERLTRQALSELRELEPPEEDQATIDEMLDKLDQATDLLPELSRAAREQDFQAAQNATQKIAEASREASEIATEYGLTECVDAGVPEETPAPG